MRSPVGSIRSGGGIEAQGSERPGDVLTILATEGPDQKTLRSCEELGQQGLRPDDEGASGLDDGPPERSAAGTHASLLPVRRRKVPFASAQVARGDRSPKPAPHPLRLGRATSSRRKGEGPPVRAALDPGIP
jgi:hypothetical protein